MNTKFYSTGSFSLVERKPCSYRLCISSTHFFSFGNDSYVAFVLARLVERIIRYRPMISKSCVVEIDSGLSSLQWLTSTVGCEKGQAWMKSVHCSRVQLARQKRVESERESFLEGQGPYEGRRCYDL